MKKMNNLQVIGYLPPRAWAAAIFTSLAFLVAPSSHAAVITWGSATAVSTGVGNSSDVSTNGTLVEAFNARDSNQPSADQIVNGVTFVTTLTLLGSNAGNVGGVSGTTASGDASYHAILNSIDFGGGQSTTIVIGDGDGDTGTLSTGLLDIGNQYEIQIWFVDDRNNRVMGFASSSTDPTVNLDDQFAIGTFTADATTQTLYLTTFGQFGNAHINAYQIRLIPEPSTALLGGIGMLALLRRRRA